MVKYGRWVLTVLLFAWLVLSFNLAPLRAYSGQDFLRDLKTDTKEVFGKDLAVSYFYDFREDGDRRNKPGIGTTVLAWKFLSVSAGGVYVSDSSDRKIDPALSFPIRLGRIPLGYGVTLGDVVKIVLPTEGWLSRLEIGPYASKNFNDKHWGAGVNANIKVW